MEEDVADHFRRLRDAVTRPIMLYHPQTTGVQLSLETLVQLVKEGVAVIKAALNALGDKVGDPLPPIQPLTGAGLATVQQVARSLAQLEESIAVGQPER